MYALVDAIGNILGGDRRIVSAFLTGQDVFEMVFSLEFDDGSNGTARVAFNFDNDPEALEWIKLKFASEVATLQLIESVAPSIPVPRVVHTDFSTTNPLGGPYILVEQSGGEPISQVIEEMTHAEREAMVAAIGEEAARLFRITLPRIGSVSGIDKMGRPIVGPMVRQKMPGRTEGPFSEVQQYIAGQLAYFTRVAESSESPVSEGGAKALLHRMSELALQIAPINDPSMQRVALVYTDLADRNISVDEDGTLLGIHGDQQASGLPSCLAATFPTFIRRDGIYSSRYRPEELNSDAPLIDDSEAAHLREVFIAATLKVDPFFAIALQKGERLRQMFELIQYNAWDGLKVWETDVLKELSQVVKA